VARGEPLVLIIPHGLGSRGRPGSFFGLDARVARAPELAGDDPATLRPWVPIGGSDTPHALIIQYRLLAGIGGGSQPRRMARSCWRGRRNTSNDRRIAWLPGSRSVVASRNCWQPVVTAAEQDRTITLRGTRVRVLT
jgi:hypothetical protein